MPRRILSFDRPDRFVCGAIGQPGQRTFFLQAAQGPRVVSVALEKAQVAVLAERLAILLIALRQGGVAVDEDATAGAPKLSEPVMEQFRVGTLTIAWDGERERVVIEARELTDDTDEVEVDDEEDEAAETLETVDDRPFAPLTGIGGRPDAVRVHLHPNEAMAFASGAVAVVHAGRPPCPQCGAPLDPTGHFCPRRNGFTH